MLMADSFWTPLFALDRLNSWLRSNQPLWCAARSALKPVIYWTKTHAILEVSKRYHVGLRRVMVKKQCRVCGGSGTWFHYLGYQAEYGERCRACRGSGIVTLRFVETRIGPICWHTPAHKWASSSLDAYVPFPCFAYEETDGLYEVCEGWEPCQTGRPMSLADAKRDMLIVLRQWPHDVCFSLDFHHHAETEKHWRIPDVRKAETWLRGKFDSAALSQLSTLNPEPPEASARGC